MNVESQSGIEANILESEALAPTVTRGVVWAYAAYAGSKALVFVTTILLARLLTPADFGIVGFATIVTDYLGTLRDFGVGEALIQRKTKIEQAANATFVVSIVSGLALFGLALVLAPVAASFFNEPLVTPLLSVLAFSYIIASFGTVHDALIVKDLDFKRRILPQVLRAIFKGGSSIALAVAGFGVWSIVIGQVLGSLAGTAAFWIIHPWRPTRAWDNTVLRQVLGFGGQIIAIGFIGNIQENLDYLIIGKRLGDTALGLYTLAFRAPELLILNFVAVLAEVVFPTFSKLQDDRNRLGRSLLSTMHLVSLIAVPAGIGLALVSGPFVHLFYTGKWAEAVPAMQVLSIYASLRALTYNIGDAYKAIGRADILNKLGILSLVVLVPAMWGGAYYGILGVAVGHLIIAVFNLLVEVLVLWRLLGISPWQVFKSLTGAVTSTTAMAGAMLAAGLATSHWGNQAQLVLLIAVGSSAYAGFAWIVNRGAVHKILTAVLRMFGLHAPAVEAVD